MLHLARKIRGAPIRAVDGEVGTLEDFYFEQERWTVRYLVVDTRHMGGRKVLISPMSVEGAWGKAEIRLTLTKDQIRDSPQVGFETPLSREAESSVLGYYGYPDYWGGGGLWGTYDNPMALLGAGPRRPRDPAEAATAGINPDARQLRSVNASTGYHLHATDGEIGHVDDFLVGEDSWRIRYLLVDTSNWIGGRSVVVSSSVVDGIDRETSALRVGVSRDEIKGSPAFESIEAALNPAETGPPFIII